MATTGEKLVELSSLSTGTALEHLLAITTGGGTGETIIVDSFIHAEVSTELDASIDAGDIAAGLDDELVAELGEELAAELDDDLEGDINQ